MSSFRINEETPLTTTVEQQYAQKHDQCSTSFFKRFVTSLKTALTVFQNEMATIHDNDGDFASIGGNEKSNFHCSLKKLSYPIIIGSALIWGSSWLFRHCQDHHYFSFVDNNSVTPNNKNYSCPTFDDDNAFRLKRNQQHESYLSGLQHGAVASDQEVCSNIGRSILQDKGGNAVDAAVATVFCLGVVNPSSSGLGGGAFMLLHVNRSHYEERRMTSNITVPPFIDKRGATYSADTTAKIDNERMMTEVIDCREQAPQAATEDMFVTSSESSSFGGLAVAVPGELKCLELAHARHGRLPWPLLIQPSIELAQEGVLISHHLAKDLQEVESNLQVLNNATTKFKSLIDFWSNPRTKTFYKKDDVFKSVNLAETLRTIAHLGSDGLYQGQVAQNLVDSVIAAGGILTVSDLKSYRPVIRSPIVGATTSGLTVMGIPPPSSGGAVLMGALRFLSFYREPLAFTSDTLSVHRTVEALRHVFAIRMSLCDPDYDNSNTTTDALKDLIHGEYMEKLQKLSLDNNTLPLSQYGGRKWAKLHDGNTTTNIQDAHEGDRRRRLAGRPFGYLEDSGTSHLSIVDREGNAVSVTTSINNVFGSYVLSPSTGMLLGNTMDDFGNPGKSNHYGLKPSKENFITPGKRPLSSMSPTMIFQTSTNKLMLVLGGSGGPKIITAVLQVILNYYILGMSLWDALVRPRIHEQLLYHDAAITTVEKTELTVDDKNMTLEVSQRTKDGLLKRGHPYLLDIDYAGTVQAIAIDLETNTLSAVSDIRKEGKPAGY